VRAGEDDYGSGEPLYSSTFFPSLFSVPFFVRFIPIPSICVYYGPHLRVLFLSAHPPPLSWLDRQEQH